MLRDKWGKDKIAKYISLSAIVFIALFIPFAKSIQTTFPFILQRLSLSANQYPYTSVNAFNFWGIFGLWKSDTLIYQTFGLLIIAAIYVALAKKLSKKKKSVRYILLAVSLTASFMFSTRVHERHLLPALAPILVSTALNPLFWIPYIGFSLTYLMNLRYSFIWISRDFYEVFPAFVVKLLAILNLGLFVTLLLAAVDRLDVKRFQKQTKALTSMKKADLKDVSPKLKEIISKKKVKFVLLFILVFSLITRLAWLNSPDKEYFDEVYHAFTARRMLHADPKAWEWWNPHPEGFAYEWTHPPLAKEGMVLGMMVFGENSFGWRIIGAILGVGSVYLVYVLAKELFKNETAALLSSGIFALEGLPLATSRIAMNDAYLLFFVLLSIYLYIKDKHFFAAIAFGLAMSSKWSGLWAIPIFFATYFALKKKISTVYIWYAILPLLIYVATYIPMFLTGHGFDIFVGVQRQMWWYHTGLDATHPFTSSWWSWPIMLKPVWVYAGEAIDSSISNIYIMSNPVVIWGGLLAIALCLYWVIVERNRKVGLVVFSYFVFFVPWALSPRIMFYYHYLPSIPFLAIATGYVLTRFANKKFILVYFGLALFCFLYFYPRYSGIQIPIWLDSSFHWFNTW